jgi:hypothetical protein
MRAMTKSRLSPEALAYLAAYRRDLLDLRRRAAQHEREIEEARRQLKRTKKKGAKLDQFVARKHGSKGFEREGRELINRGQVRSPLESGRATSS